MWLEYRWRQMLACAVVVSGLATTGSMVGWSVEVERLAKDPQLPFNISEAQQRWLVSSVGIASVVSTLGTGWLVEAVGPCRLLGALLLPQGLAWVTMAVTYSLPWLFVGRVITGAVGVMLTTIIQVSVCVLTTIIQPLIAELCQPDVRGMLSALPEMAMSLGLLGVYVFARVLTWQAGTLLCGILVLPALFGVLFVPESPYWLIKNGKEKQATRALMQLRAPSHDLEAEVLSIREGLAQQAMEEGSFLQQIRAMRDGSNYRPVLLLSLLMVLKEGGGAMFIFMYSAFFFVSAGVTWDPFTCTVLVGVTRLLFTFISALVIDKVGRRPLLIFSSLTCGVAMFVIGGLVRADNPSLAWIPLVAALVFVASFGLGVGPVPWILVGEMLPTPVRSLAASICTCLFAFFTFLLSELMPQIIDATGLDDVVFAFGTFQFLLAVTTWLFVPETQHRTLEDLQTAFSGAALRPFRKAREGYLQAYGSTFSEASSSQTKAA
ncbi:Major facilitator sugar transporter-like [Trinorchestia longiramus]|nr:Major facilitator sugar transporter-like [Trinorchestia longiramus]